MNIKEYWARLVSAGSAPDWENVVAEWHDYIQNYNITDGEFGYELLIQIEYSDDIIQLRKDGIDLHKLKWRKPTKKDVGKMYWYYDWEYKYITGRHTVEQFDKIYNYCLVADHGNIAPTPEDFKEVYDDF